MGQKINPISFRIGGIYTWNSKWFSNKGKYKDLLKQDILIKEFLKKKLREAIVEKIEIERSPAAITVTVYAAKPGLIIGRAGAGIEALKKELSLAVLRKKSIADVGRVNLNFNVKEIAKPHLSSAVIAHSIIADIEKRIPFRRAMKQAMGRAERAGALGVKVMVGGRLNGSEIARSEMLATGKIPLHTLRADIDYHQGIAQTIYGVIGVKVWIYRGEIFENKAKNSAKKAGVKKA